jgi:hypothetical protein
MRTTLLALLLAVFAASAANACAYHMTMAQGDDQAQPPQTAQTQAPAQYE